MKNPRWYILLFLACFDAYALSFPWFNRGWPQLAAALAGCLAADAGLGLKRPVSAVISALGLFLLCDSPDVWPYFAVGAVSIASKRLVQVDGRHVFNPTNFGMVAALLCLPHDVVTDPGRWANPYRGLLLIGVLGLLTAWRARRLDVALAYVLGFAALARLRGPAALAPMTGAAFALFSFYMITDPATTPRTAARRVLFGLAVAAADNLLRWLEAPHAPLFALFALSAVRPALEGYIDDRQDGRAARQDEQQPEQRQRHEGRQQRPAALRDDPAA